MENKGGLNFAEMQDELSDTSKKNRLSYRTEERMKYAYYAYMQDPKMIERKSQSSQFYFPGKSPGQPYKYDSFKQCYHFVLLKGDKGMEKFTKLIQVADQRINYWDSQLGRKNPYNPFSMSSEFKITDVSRATLDKLKSNLASQGVFIAEDMVVMEGCAQDDKVMLGGKKQFLSHFCTLFNFDMCTANTEKTVFNQVNKLFSDP